MESLKQDFGSILPDDIENKEVDDLEVLDTLTEPVQRWWIEEFGKYTEENKGFFTPPQKEAIPHINNNESTLVASPTGSGKTLTSFVTEIDRLYRKARNQELENSVYCIYVSPLKSLANDINSNLEKPIDGISEYVDDDAQEIRHAIRHGDTPSNERQKMLEETPHILNTTPETLGILLNSPKFSQKLETVDTVIVDEIHSLASNKRGVHLSLSLERLQNISNNDITRIGCSATVEPLDEVAKYLVGYDIKNNKSRDYKIVDTRFVRDTDLKVKTPVEDFVDSDSSDVSNRFYSMLDSDIQSHSTTIVFTNTRSGAESTLSNLRTRFNYYDNENSAVHHGSLGKEERQRVENQLRDGELDVVTTSTSLELGIDMNDVDLVVQVGSPKSIASLLQRIGRAGHQLGQTVEGRVYVLERDELIECTTMIKKANEGYIDRIFIPENCYDVISQHIYGIAINKVRPEYEVYDIIRGAHPYRNYSKEQFELTLRYLSADYEGLEDRNVYPKIWRDENDPVDGEYHYDEYEVGRKLIGKRGKQARMIYYTNIGTIPDSFTCSVYVRGEDIWVGELDEEYLNTLDKGDVFQLGGDNYEYRYRRGSKVYTDRTGKAPTVPSWFSERLPLSYDLGVEILNFQSEITENINNNEARDWLREHPIDENTIEALINLYQTQIDYMGDDSVSTLNSMNIETYIEDDMRMYVFQSCYGRKFNDGISRLIAQYLAEDRNINVQVAVNDHGFSLKLPGDELVDMNDVLDKLYEKNIDKLIRDSLEGTDFLKRYFRINAGRSLLILRNYKGNHKSAKRQQVTSEMLLGFISDIGEDFAVLEETYREISQDKLDLDKVKDFISRVDAGKINIVQNEVPTPSPRSFSIAALASEDIIVAGDKSEALENFHNRVMDEIES